MFWFSQLPPLSVTVVLLAALTVVAMSSMQITGLSLLPRLCIFLFSLPFSATAGYLFDREYVWWQTPSNARLCQNHPMVNQMLWMALVGLCGMMIGLEFSGFAFTNRAKADKSDRPRANVRLLPLFATAALLGVSFSLSWLHAPEKDIWQSAYASVESAAGKDVEAGLNSSSLISYLILILLYIDSEHEPLGASRRYLKQWAIGCVTLYIVVVLQFMRGDRECVGLIAAFGMLYISGPMGDRARQQLKQGYLQLKRFYKVIIPLAVCAVAFVALGSLRHSASQAQTQHESLADLIVDGATQNTWTAVALNNLGLAADYDAGTLTYLYGQTYIDYIVSLPPGAITKAMGIERPIDGDSNPSLWYFGSVATGGMHPVIVPFRNFGIWGVIVINLFWGAFIGYCDLNNDLYSIPRRLLYGCLAVSAMRWFWYGDMSMIRALMIWAILALAYRILAVSSSRSFVNNRQFNYPQQYGPSIRLT